MNKIDYHALREKAEKATCGEWSAVFNTENICFHANNPLRAAMIVFLMMQENQNG